MVDPEPFTKKLDEQNKLKVFNKILKNALNQLRDAMKMYSQYPCYSHLFQLNSVDNCNTYHKEITFFESFIKECKSKDPDEIIQARSETEKYKEKVAEYYKIQHFVKSHYDKSALPQNPVNNNNNQELPQVKENNALLSQPEGKENLDLDQKLKKTNEEDDIKVEPINTLLGKKKERDGIDLDSIYHPQKKAKKMLFTCYICKCFITKELIHHLYSFICKRCGDSNEQIKSIKLDLTGRIAVVTGGRVKIGYEIVKKLLSYNCKVIVTSRFPRDTLFKYQKEAKYSEWKDNLIIYSIDFRFFKSTVKFINYLYENFTHIDILINNAAQTIRRTSAYYKYLLPIEATELKEEDESRIAGNEDYISLNLIGDDVLRNDKNDQLQSTSEEIALIRKNEDKNEILPFSVFSSQLKVMKEKYQPDKTTMGTDGQPYDFSSGKSSWNMEIDDVPFEEFMEVHIINAWTPYYLNAKLKPLLIKSPFNDKYIVNVSSVEGMFNTNKKTKHPHTNMAKAALNMMTRTVGKYYEKDGIYMTSCDTGWVSEMNELNQLFDDNTNEKAHIDFVNVPLDTEDGAIRVLYSIIKGVMDKKYLYGINLKDYKESQW